MNETVSPDDLDEVTEVCNKLKEVFMEADCSPPKAVAAMFLVLKRLVDTGAYSTRALHYAVDMIDDLVENE